MARGDFDERDDDFDDRRPLGDPAVGRRRARSPGLLLALSGGLGAAVGLALLVLSLTKPMLVADAIIDNVSIPLIELSPPSPERDAQLKRVEQQRAEAAAAAAQPVSPVSVVSSAVPVVAALVALLGGLKLRATSGYGLALTGAIVGLLPANYCCCLTLPIGIWALVTVLNPDVKAAFAANRRPALGRE